MQAVGAPLIERQMTPCALLTRRSEPDGLGGHITRYERGKRFLAAILPVRSDEAYEQEKQGARERCTVTTPEGVGLRFHDVLMRESDGALFRCTTCSRESAPPGCATFHFEQVYAKRWTPTDGLCDEEGERP